MCNQSITCWNVKTFKWSFQYFICQVLKRINYLFHFLSCSFVVPLLLCKICIQQKTGWDKQFEFRYSKQKSIEKIFVLKRDKQFEFRYNYPKTLFVKIHMCVLNKLNKLFELRYKQQKKNFEKIFVLKRDKQFELRYKTKNPFRKICVLNSLN